MLGINKRQRSDKSSQGYKQGLGANAGSHLDVVISGGLHTGLGGVPQLEPGHAIRVTACLERSTSGRTVCRARFRCLAHKSHCQLCGTAVARHIDGLPNPPKTTRLLIPSGVLFCIRRVKHCPLTNSAINIGSYTLSAQPPREAFFGGKKSWKPFLAALTWTRMVTKPPTRSACSRRDRWHRVAYPTCSKHHGLAIAPPSPHLQGKKPTG